MQYVIKIEIELTGKDNWDDEIAMQMIKNYIEYVMPDNPWLWNNAREIKVTKIEVMKREQKNG